jgi:threonine dehydrogenase-like Zn-dependent dehydrogenase
MSGLLSHFGKQWPTESAALVFDSPGHVAYRENVPTAADVVAHIANGRNQRWVIYAPLAVARCFSDTRGGAGGGFPIFPEGSRRFEDGLPAIPGHESYGRLVGGPDEALRRLESRGIRLGDDVIGDINIACGNCRNDLRGGPPVGCENGIAFAGIGTMPSAERWLLNQTGRTHLPGAYVGPGGIMVFPTENIYRIPPQAHQQGLPLELFTQADGLACAYGMLDKVNIDPALVNERCHYPTILFFGAGNLGFKHGFVFQDALPRARLLFADPNEGNLTKLGDALGIPVAQRYLLNLTNTDRYTKAGLNAGFECLKGTGTHEKPIDAIIDCSGRLTADDFNQLSAGFLAAEGCIVTDALSLDGIVNVTSEHMLIGQRFFTSSATPLNNIPRAIDLILRKGALLANSLQEIPGGLFNEELPSIVAGERDLGDRPGSTFYTRLM